jgi:hypothetical protein
MVVENNSSVDFFTTAALEGPFGLSIFLRENRGFNCPKILNLPPITPPPALKALHTRSEAGGTTAMERSGMSHLALGKAQGFMKPIPFALKGQHNQTVYLCCPKTVMWVQKWTSRKDEACLSLLNAQFLGLSVPHL